MRKVREVLRLKDKGLSGREVAASVGIGPSTVGDYVQRAQKAGLTWEAAKIMSDAEVESRLFEQVGRNEPWARAPIDLSRVHMELRRPGVTLELLWNDYQQGVAAGSSGLRPYQYSRFCELYAAYTKRLSPVMRQTHRAGEKAFIDFSGKRPRLFDPQTGASKEVELFVMVLGASNYTYAEATLTQTLEDFAGATVRGLEYFGGVPEILVPDQLKSAVSKADRYEPEINATYAELGAYYATAIVPARPRKPRDKAKVEGAVLIVQRWILACMRDRRFFCLEELNAAIWELLERLNTRPFKKLEGCRRSAFETLDRPALRPLPAQRYEVGRWKLGVGVNIDHHITYDDRHYSVPSELIGAKVDVRATATVIEVWRDGARIASHARSHGPKGTAVTRSEHRPRSHREWGDWPPERLLGWAGTRGPKTAEVAAAILKRGPHPESGRRSCLGLMRLGDKYGDARLEAASARALALGNPTRRTVESMLRTGLDKGVVEEEAEPKRVVHDNVRGGAYFDREEVVAKSAEEVPGDEQTRTERAAVMESTREEEAIEARYLEDERQAIIHEPSLGVEQTKDRGASEEVRRPEEVSAMVMSQDGTCSGAPVMEPLSELIGRAKEALSRPLVVKRIGRRSMDIEGGSSEEWCGSSCTSHSDCIEPMTNKHVPEEVPCREDVCEDVNCHRGEVE